MCHDGRWDPFSTLSANGSRLSHRGTSGRMHAPLLMHAHGDHTRIERAVYGTRGIWGRPLPAELRTPAALAAAWRRTYGVQTLLDYPLLLIDSAQEGLCKQTTLGALGVGVESLGLGRSSGHPSHTRLPRSP